MATSTLVSVHTAASGSLRGAALWSGPLEVTVASAPIMLGDWRSIGLGGWSGAVRYERTVEVPAGATAVEVDLGRVRGSAKVEIDDAVAARLFCAPFATRVPLPEGHGEIRLAVTVYNTIAPFLDETTPLSRFEDAGGQES